jgi:hypothetical protein
MTAPFQRSNVRYLSARVTMAPAPSATLRSELTLDSLCEGIV